MLGLGMWLRLGYSATIGGAGEVVSIFIDSDIVRTFSEAVDPLTVTNTSPAADGTGSFELYNETDAAWVNGVLSTADNIQWTFNPTSNFTIGDRLTLHLTSAIESDVGANPYEGPFEIKYRVVNRLPVMATFTVDATSADANIGILTTTGTDADSHTLTFGISLTDDSSTVTTWQNEAAWQASGFDTGLSEGTNETVTLYCFAKDTEGGVSVASISDSCAVDIPDVTKPIVTAFTVEPTSVVANIAILSLSGTDNITTPANLLFQVNEVATAPAAGVGTWKSAAQWIIDGYTSSVVEGFPETVTLYAWAKDEAATPNVSAAPTLTDSCDVTITHSPTFSVQPTLNTALYDGGTFDFTVADINGAHTVDVDAFPGPGFNWVRVLTNVAVGAKTGIEVSGIGPGAITNEIKFRVADTGDTNYTVSDYVDVTTVAPVLTSVTGSDTKNTLVFADNANDTADSFNIKWGTSTGVLTNTITGVTSPYEHTGLTNDTTYYYEVVAIKGSITSTGSIEKSGTPTAVTFTILDSTNKGADLTLSGGDLTVSNTVNAWNAITSVLGKTTGKHYIEVTFTGDPIDWIIGIGTATASVASFVGSTDQSVGYRPGQGKQFYDGTGTDVWAIESGSSDVTVGLAIDFPNRNFSVVGTDGIHDTTTSTALGGAGDLYAMISIIKGHSVATTATVNFGASSFVHSVPATYTAGLS